MLALLQLDCTGGSAGALGPAWYQSAKPELKDATVASSSEEDEDELQRGSAACAQTLQTPGGTAVQRMLDRSRRRVQSCSPNTR